MDSTAFKARFQELGEKERGKRFASLLNSLPTTEALLEPIGSSNTRFRWQYDQHGWLIASDTILERVRNAVADFQALEHDVHEPLFKQVGFGLEFIDLWFMQHSMKWPEAVQRARRLEASTGIGGAPTQMIGDAETLAEYIAVVLAAVPRIGQAIAISKILAPRRELTSEMEDVAKALQLAQLPNDERGPRVAGALRNLEENLGIALVVPETGAEFSEKLWKLLLDVKEIEGPNEAVWQEVYLAHWRTRLRDEIARRPSRLEPSWADIAMRSWKRGEDALLQRAWDSKSSMLWTELALSSSNREMASDGILYPAWLAPYALILLGASALALATTSSAETDDLRPVIRDRKNGRFIVIVTRDDASTQRSVVTSSTEPNTLDIPNWTLSDTHAALVVSRTRLPQLAACLAPWVDAFPGRDPWLIVEGTESEGPLPPETLLESNLPPPWLKFWHPSHRLQIFAKEPANRSALSVVAAAVNAFRSTPRYIVGASSIDDAVNRADAGLRTTSNSGQ
jgi:hypothetical protein